METATLVAISISGLLVSFTGYALYTAFGQQIGEGLTLFLPKVRNSGLKASPTIGYLTVAITLFFFYLSQC